MRITLFIRTLIIFLLPLTLTMPPLPAAAVSSVDRTDDILADSSTPAILFGPFLPDATAVPLTQGEMIINITTAGFEPDLLEVAAGVAVSWVNQTATTVELVSGAPYSVFLPLVINNMVARSSALHSGRLPALNALSRQEDDFSAIIPPGGKYTYTFSNEGDYPYFLRNNPALTGRVVVTAPLFDFVLEIDPSGRSIAQGETTTYSLTVKLLSGAAEPVDLEVGGLPQTATYSLIPGYLTPDGSASLLVTTTLDTPIGDYTALITGTTGSQQHTVEANLTITPHPDFNLSAAPAERQIAQGAGTTYTVSLASLNGFSIPVDLSVSGLPAGVTAGWDVNPQAPPGQSVLAVQTAMDTPTGAYTLTLNGAGGGFTHQVSVTLDVVPHPDFELLVQPSFRGVLIGDQAIYTVTAQAFLGFTSPVSLSLSSSPPATSITWGLNPVLPGQSTQLTVSTTPGTPADSYALEISGVGGGLVHTATVTLNVGDLPDLVLSDLSVFPSPVDQNVTFTVTARVVNQGAGDAGPFQITWQADSAWQSPSTRVYSGTWELAELVAGESMTLTAVVAANAPGVFKLHAQADSLGVVRELEEGNNSRSGELGVRGAVPVCGAINQDATWAYAVYVLTCNVEIPNSVTLTIRDGAIVKAQQEKFLSVSGMLVTIGSPNEPIVFTSYVDDGYGGDTNGDGSASAPAPGNWLGVWLKATGRTAMSYTRVAYGGAYVWEPYWTSIGDITSGGGVVELDHVILEKSGGRGLFAGSGAVVTATNVTVEHNALEGFYQDGGSLSVVDSRINDNGQHGVHFRQGALSISGGTVQHNGLDGVYGYNIAPVISGTAVLSNTQDAVYLSFSGSPLDAGGIHDLTVSGNAVNGLTVAGTLGGNSTMTNTTGQTFVLDGLVIPNGASLELAPGIVIKAKDEKVLDVSGVLTSAGTLTAPVILTSLRDDGYGGDTNGDGSASAPAPGNWLGVWLKATGRTAMSYTRVAYGGAYVWNPYWTRIGDITSGGGVVELDHVILEKSGGRGLFAASGAVVTATNVTVEHNALEGFYQDGGSLSLVDSRINDNGQHGVHFRQGALSISGGTVQHNGLDGVYGYNIAPVISGTAVLSNTQDAVYLSFSGSPLDAGGIHDLTVSGNAVNGLTVAGTLGGSSTMTNTTGQIFVQDGLVIPNGASLELAPGIVIKAKDEKVLDMSGVLTSAGTLTAPVILTSLRDDGYGGDTNGDGSASAPSPGNWLGVWLKATGRTAMSYTRVAYGGAYVWNPYWTSIGDITSGGGVVELDHVILEKSGGRGLFAASGAVVTATNVTVEHNALEGFYQDGGSLSLVDSRINENGQHGVHFRQGALSISGGTVQQNGLDGVYGYNIAPVISGTAVLSNTQDAVYLSFSGSPLDAGGIHDLTVSGNAVNGLTVAGTLGGSSTMTNTTGQTFVLDGLVIPNGASLELAPGIMIKAKDEKVLDVSGVLTSAGTLTAPVVLTSLRDDGYGGDTNGDGSASTPSPGNWLGVWLKATGRTAMSYTRVAYGGAYVWNPYWTSIGDITSGGGVVELDHVILEKSGGRGLFAVSGAVVTGTQVTAQNNAYGIHIDGGSLDLSSCQLLTNTQIGLQIIGNSSVNVMTTTFTANSTGLQFSGAISPTLRNNSYASNTTWGVENLAAFSIDASFNWWGAASGPTHSSNPGGTGDKVTDRVIFTPWLAAKP